MKIRFDGRTRRKGEITISISSGNRYERRILFAFSWIDRRSYEKRTIANLVRTFDLGKRTTCNCLPARKNLNPTRRMERTSSRPKINQLLKGCNLSEKSLITVFKNVNEKGTYCNQTRQRILRDFERTNFGSRP